MIILFVNCRLYPFVAWILDGLKTYETRNKNTLCSMIGKRVYLAQTGKGKRPVIYGSCIISSLVTVTDKRTYNRYRKQAMIEKGSCYDFTGSTKKKCLYRLENPQRCEPFTMPENVVRHGRVYAQTID